MKKKGFTLIELMIAISVFSIFSICLYATFSSQLRQTVNYNDNIELQYNLNKALTMITDQLRSNENIATSAPAQNGSVSQIYANSETIIDLNSNSSIYCIYYTASSKTLKDNNGNKCEYINSIMLKQDGDLISIAISASKGKVNIKSSTSININK